MHHTPQNVCDTQKKLTSQNMVHSLEVTAASAGQVAREKGQDAGPAKGDKKE